MRNSVCSRKKHCKTIIFCFGEGGHKAQADRLAKVLQPYLEGHRIVSLGGIKENPSWSKKHYEIDELKTKYSVFDTLKNTKFIKIFRTIINVSKGENITAMISTGPGVCILAGIYFKFKGIKVIHVESWSRINTSSFTGMFMYHIADKFYVQHKTLLKKYPNGIYAGIL